jgi:hypothetical protein
MVHVNCKSVFYLLMLLSLCLSGNSQSPISQKKIGKHNERTSYVIDLSYTNVTLNYENWDTDMAIMVKKIDICHNFI